MPCLSCRFAVVIFFFFFFPSSHHYAARRGNQTREKKKKRADEWLLEGTHINNNDNSTKQHCISAGKKVTRVVYTNTQNKKG
jgi:hypothetical protein